MDVCWSYSYKVNCPVGMELQEIELQCSGDQLVCPLQSITCQCVVKGDVLIITWKSQSQIITQLEASGHINVPVTKTNFTVTVEGSTNEMSSNLSFTAQLQSDATTIKCLNFNENSLNFSYSFVGGHL